MNSVGIFVKTLVALSFVWCIGESVLPDKSFKNLSSFIYGIIVVSMALSLFTAVDYDAFDVIDFNVDKSSNNNYLVSLYEEKLEDALSEKFGDDSVRVELTDDFKVKNIYCDNKETYDAIMRYLNENN